MEDSRTHLITARVALPNCLETSLRTVAGRKEWRTERAASKDAAFQAYAALYEVGLLNENLLPFSHQNQHHEYIAPRLDVKIQFSP
jgi:hypothetical protein